jgi:hypothetical protein
MGRSPRLRRSLLDLKPGETLRARSRIRHQRPKLRQAYRLLRATGRLGVPGALPGPPELLAASARVLAQGYLNRFSLPLLREWLLPRWMREQTNPTSPTFVPRSVINLMVNQTARNWTALGIPGGGHPVESTVDKYGLLTPVPGGPSWDWWVQFDGGAGTMAASQQADVVQRLQGGLPVVLTEYEAGGLRVSSEAWMMAAPDGDWAAMQVILFNIADVRLQGMFSFALRPYNAEGLSPIYDVAFDRLTLQADGKAGPVVWPQPEGFALSGLRSGDLFCDRPKPGDERSLYDTHGLAHGVLRYRFDIEPGEEAEFLLFAPVHKPADTSGSSGSLFNPTSIADPNAYHLTPDTNYYNQAKAATALEWRALLEQGMKVELPDRDLQESWEANRAHLLALHDGHEITPGPDLYHSFWLRDAAYMVNALSECGYAEAASQLLRGFLRHQRRDGSFVSHRGEWDSTGQALWAICRHLALHPDRSLLKELRPGVERGANWLAYTLSRSADGLMPPGIASEHLGPPDLYYWDNLWSLAGLESAVGLLGRDRPLQEAATTLRETLARHWQVDADRLGREAMPAAPGRGIDIGAVGSLVAWFPLELLPAASWLVPRQFIPLLAGTLQALEETTFHEGALFVGTGHSGWGTYLNMRIAGCRILQGSQGGWELMRWLLRHASPTYNWPEAIYPRGGGGSAGDGHHGWASAEWLMLVRALLVHESPQCIVINPLLPDEWLAQAGRIAVRDAPTRFGLLAYTVEWAEEGRAMRLQMDPRWHSLAPEVRWKVPGRVVSAKAGDVDLPLDNNASVPVPPGCAVVEAVREP